MNGGAGIIDEQSGSAAAPADPNADEAKQDAAADAAPKDAADNAADEREADAKKAEEAADKSAKDDAAADAEDEDDDAAEDVEDVEDGETAADIAEYIGAKAYTEVDGNMYFLCESTCQWTVAREECEALGGELASIPDQKTQDAISKMISEQGGLKFYWVGMRAQSTESGKQFLWVDGTDADYTNWAPGEPNDKRRTEKGENFVGVWAKDGTWNDFIDEGYETDGDCGFICMI